MYRIGEFAVKWLAATSGCRGLRVVCHCYNCVAESSLAMNTESRTEGWVQGVSQGVGEQLEVNSGANYTGYGNVQKRAASRPGLMLRP
ncbi:hypothetical protein J6590_038871 [Homalodisca vitripennis]|nr:hypothetical protein J6590_038871 [Homalodisca vitripennis]